MINVLHISTECYPAAKAGGMGDVVGALPIYQNKEKTNASVIIPHYDNKWIRSRSFDTISKGKFKLGDNDQEYQINQLKNNSLGFSFYTVSLPGLFDRPNIYLNENGNAYHDEISRNISFQRAILEWLMEENVQFDLLHCHDHMTGLIPFILQYSPTFKKLKKTPTFFTIHNGQYRGVMEWKHAGLLPPLPEENKGLLDWDGEIHSLACAIKCADRITTVSPSYMLELINDFDTLTSLMKNEKSKSLGVLNGIDNTLWDPSYDPMLPIHLKKSISRFKSSNRRTLAEEHDFEIGDKALVSFIGRFAYEKGADLLAGAFDKYLFQNDDIHFFILGSGDKTIETDIIELGKKYPNNVTSVIAYNEQLAHHIYGASDFILMPSRFEPCGLNQMYAMRYGTIPIVRSTGGLKDTVPDIGDEGNGISFLRATEEDIVYSLGRIQPLYKNKKELKALREKIMSLDFDWTQSARKYIEEYKKIM